MDINDEKYNDIKQSKTTYIAVSSKCIYWKKWDRSTPMAYGLI